MDCQKNQEQLQSRDYSLIEGNVRVINQSVTGLFENEFVIK